MIRVYGQSTTDFSVGGLGVIHPTEARVRERHRGEYGLDLVHPRDAAGAWRLLECERIVVCPTPGEHPDVAALRQSGESRPVLTAATPVPVTLGGLTLRRQCRVLALDAAASAGSWRVVTRQGDVGYVTASAVTQDGTATVAGFGVRRGCRQPFRIMQVSRTETEITAYARHLWYDATGCVVAEMDGSGKTYPQAVAMLEDALLGGTLPASTGAPDGASTTHDIKYAGKNAVEILLGGGGLLETWECGIYRSWYAWHAYTETSAEVPVLRGSAATSVEGMDEDTDVYTHIVPMGADANGRKLFLPEVAVVSEYADLYPRPMYRVISVTDAKVASGMTKTQALAKMRKAAQDELAAGCDLPAITCRLDAAAVRDNPQLQAVRLGGVVRVAMPRLGIVRTLPCTEYEYDALLGVYTRLTLGDPPATLASAAMADRRARLITEGVIAGGGEPVQEETETTHCTATHNALGGGGWNNIPSGNNAIVGVSGGSSYSARLTFAKVTAADSLIVKVPRSMSSGGGTWRIHITNDATAHGTSGNAVFSLPVSKGTGTVSVDLTGKVSTIVGWASVWYVIITCSAGLYWVPGGTTTEIDTGVYS